MSSSENGHKADVFDLTEAVPQTQRLDTSLQKARAQLSVRRHRPSRSRLRDSLSSIEDDSLDRKSSQSYSSPLHSSCSPLHCLLHPSSSVSPDLPSSSPAQRGRAFTFDPSLVGPALAEVRRRHRPLQSDSSQEALLLSPTRSPSKGSSACGRPSSGSSSLGGRQQEGPLNQENDDTDLHNGDKSQLYEEARSNLHQGDQSQSEDDSHDTGTDDAGSPTVLLDKKTKRRFLDLGVTLRRTYGKVRKDRTNRIESTEARPSRSSAPSLVPFSWFSEKMRSSGKANTQAATKADSPVSKQQTEEHQRPSHPYQSLSQSTEEITNVMALRRMLLVFFGTVFVAYEGSSLTITCGDALIFQLETIVNCTIDYSGIAIGDETTCCVRFFTAYTIENDLKQSLNRTESTYKCGAFRTEISTPILNPAIGKYRFFVKTGCGHGETFFYVKALQKYSDRGWVVQNTVMVASIGAAVFLLLAIISLIAIKIKHLSLSHFECSKSLTPNEKLHSTDRLYDFDKKEITPKDII